MSNGRENIASLYTQLPLTSPSSSIRVLHIRPGLWYQAIKVTLSVIDLDVRPPFEALSYTWGVSSKERSITVNDTVALGVTDNLFNALRRLRSVVRTRIIWVDKVCINQEDLVERGIQVSIMAKIYEQASCVNVWLGDLGWTNPLTLAFNMPPWSALPLSEESWDLRRWRAWFMSVRNRPKMMDKAISATTPRWQDRAWTVQEFVVARKIYLCFGSVRTLFEFGCLDYYGRDCSRDLRTSLTAYRGLRKRVEYELSLLHYQLHRTTSFDFQGFLERSAQHGYNRDAFGILDVRFRLSASGAIDPRDQVYSVLGLINEEEASFIGVDYTQSCAHIYAKATYASIKSRGDFDILTFVTTNRDPSELTSWSVDFSMRTAQMSFSGRPPPSIRNQENSDRISTSSPTSTTTLVSFDESARRMTIHAAVVDRVTLILPCGHPTPGTVSLTPEFVDGTRKLLLYAQSRLSTRTVDSEAYKEMRILDIFEKSEGSQEVVEEAFSNATVVGNYDLSAIVYRMFRYWTTLTGLAPLAWLERPAEYAWALFGATQHHARNSGGSAFFVTTMGVIGIGPVGITEGDQIGRIRSTAPFIALRQDGAFHTFQGHVFLHGLWGERMLQRVDSLGFEQQRVVLC